MVTRLGLILLGLVVAVGCDLVGSPDYTEPPANSYTSAVFQLRLTDQPTSVDGAKVSAEFWSGARPVIGRLFVPEEYQTRPGPAVVVLSHDLWEESFKSDPQTIGRSIELDGVPTVIVGILAPGFHFPERARLWVPRRSGSK